jgi:hypothetical protein
MKSNQLKAIQIGYGEDQLIFHCRMISVAEEESYDAKFNDIADSDTEKHEKQFELCKEALGEFAAEMPQKLVKKKGEFVKEPLGDGTPYDAINAVFKERTPENERIIRRAFSLFKAQLDPDIRFL